MCNGKLDLDPVLDSDFTGATDLRVSGFLNGCTLSESKKIKLASLSAAEPSLLAALPLFPTADLCLVDLLLLGVVGGRPLLAVGVREDGRLFLLLWVLTIAAE